MFVLLILCMFYAHTWSYLAVTSYGEPPATGLAVQTFSQVVSMSTLQAQGRGFNPHSG